MVAKPPAKTIGWTRDDDHHHDVERLSSEVLLQNSNCETSSSFLFAVGWSLYCALTDLLALFSNRRGISFSTGVLVFDHRVGSRPSKFRLAGWVPSFVSTVFVSFRLIVWTPLLVFDAHYYARGTSCRIRSSGARKKSFASLFRRLSQLVTSRCSPSAASSSSSCALVVL
jgi:hypothetical protein